MSRLKIKPKKKFKAKLADIVNLVDAIFDGDHAMPGWVIMQANAKGRECIDGFFRKGKLRGGPLSQRYRKTGEALKSMCRM